MKKMTVALLTVAALEAVAPTTTAQTVNFMEWNKTVNRLGAQGDSYYVDFVEPFGQTCSHGVAYIKSEHKGLYAQLLAAKMGGRRISRLDYSQPGGNGTECTVVLVEI